jgi:hypothetical protein
MQVQTRVLGSDRFTHVGHDPWGQVAIEPVMLTRTKIDAVIRMPDR